MSNTPTLLSLICYCSIWELSLVYMLKSQPVTKFTIEKIQQFDFWEFRIYYCSIWALSLVEVRKSQLAARIYYRNELTIWLLRILNVLLLCLCTLSGRSPCEKNSRAMWDSHIANFAVAVCCSVLQCVAVCCSVLQCAHIARYTAAHCNTLQHTATHCNTLQHTAAHCNTLQHTATAKLAICESHIARPSTHL